MADTLDPSLPAEHPQFLPQVAGEAPPLVRSEDLLNGRREILIAHCEEVYRLRLTRNGKLILTK